MKRIKYKKLYLIIYKLILIITISNQYSVKAFIPNIYLPTDEYFKKKADEIAETAKRLIYFGEINKAKQILELAVKINYKNEQLWSLLAETQIQTDDYYNAIISLKNAQKINTKKASYIFREANINIILKNRFKAIDLVKKGLKIEPKNLTGLFQLGNLNLMNKNYFQALKAYDKAIEIKPLFWQVINNKALIYYEIGKKKEAIGLWKEVLKITKDAEPMLAIAAAIFDSKGNNDKSISLAKKALSQDPKYALQQHQKDQLWGKNLQKATKKLLNSKFLEKATIEALERSNIKNGP